MRGSPRILINTPEIELWPASLLRACSNADARLLAGASNVLRRKRDGRYLAALLPSGAMPLQPRWLHEPGIGAALDAAEAMGDACFAFTADPEPLPLHHLHERLRRLDIDADAYAERTGLALVAEPAWLAFAGFDRYRRPLWLHPRAARAWERLCRSARADGISLEAISGYRSHDYQLGIFERKLARGQTLPQILQVNAAPGFSEHHSGLALDISSPGEPPAEESFEHTPAFAWLGAHAAGHGFAMSYPRDNPHGIVYEPWHWRYHPD
ncbi:peptidase [Pseudoxanthomonas kalamensis DSM 18571]|uniref:M15 family metallopeptidase n=1 Tax=Pseudoxanthomonas kalamensis TaxID=289483 RepID=UPI001391A318|nr:M15 family metallopeptidase [Pseudoxanthomonas kalamensis]KAF1709362.1 peptidase [Pseudoxanthomonas kalamensis DSM 18571]